MHGETSGGGLRACGGVALVALLLATSGLSRAADAIPPSPANEEARCVGYPAAGSAANPGHDQRGGGFVDYLDLFYCVLGGAALGYAAMAAWLAVLFYLLADTAAVYFCPSLEGLARLLGLPPAIAGATLLSLGNGAPDALSALASFAAGAGGGAAAAVGLSGVLGGAMFVSTAVLGVVALRVGAQGVAVDRASFFRDAGFLLLALAAVAVVLAAAKSPSGAPWRSPRSTSSTSSPSPSPPTAGRDNQDEEEDHAAASSELHSVAETKFYTDQEAQDSLLSSDTAPLLRYYAGDNNGGAGGSKSAAFRTVMRVLALPLSLPRRLTIPDASKERWSKPTAVTAATLAPIFLSILWSHRATGWNPLPAVLLGGLAGVALGLLAFLTTDASAPPPPGRFLAAWLAGGFATSVAWAYVIANEVLSLLVSAGAVLSVDAAALGVTVLAWGNSLGDLIANVAVASRGGPGGAQVAVAGCHGGPVFSVLVGLGLSMLLSCWAGYPRPVKIPREPGLYRTLGFVVAGLWWALVTLPRRGMRVDRTLGFGLLAIYFCFVCINISQLKNEG
ncbi:hypothetical protein PVAP13_9KG206100 [Panicum virgatum]|uniref:Sodium/calcium exchanger membrane region domain-containing protein n=1 Tax=Panicum virgatum TaxID=38727 RepID=A0A8T0NJY6_PANVG|nr:hypothetical protein PVAP13_9KG206100 [Panicum virgatum]